VLRGGQEAGVEEHLVQGSVEPVGDILLDCGDLLEQGERLYRRVEGGLVHHLEEQVRVLVKAIKKNTVKSVQWGKFSGGMTWNEVTLRCSRPLRRGRLC